MKITKLALVLTVLSSTLPLTASAYVGPGAGLTVIGSALALIAGILFAIVGFVWYPIKRLFRKKSKSDTQPGQGIEVSQDNQ